MKRVAILSALFLLFACTSRAQQTTYDFSWSGLEMGSANNDLVMNVPDMNTTAVKIIVTSLPQGCGGAQAYSYSIVSGPALVVGEWIDIHVGYNGVGSGIFAITGFGTDSEGNPTFTTTFHSCTAGWSGSAIAGSSANPVFDLQTRAYNWEYGVTCNPSDSAFHFTLLHADGTLSQEMSTPNSVTCSIPRNVNTRNVTLTGQFSATLTTGEAVTGTFTTSGYIDRYGRYEALSAAWSITSPTPVDGLVPGGTGGGGH